ncbi:cytochrome c oxidase assembly protein [Magnetospirillum sp. UT-4]|uniref:cytochrome c oxidase assembly protein n=1 Tax=Magnetospirillum sp. UT-4 TaxID=2681467 RepID=UPI0013801F0E|nr:cytochrome c oxidase assembly protein [Magnetospirillum sp. UT-4]CAA7613645.1 Cytochrome c oxidase assembly protein CtaG [Magnetospirillum sp. UT-4]
MTPRATVAASVAAVAAMLGLVAASVPLYDMVCRATGLGGATRTATAAPGAEEAGAAAAVVTIRFDASVAKDLPWRFEPGQRQMRVHLGEQALAFFRATNTSSEPVVGTATFNVTPDRAGRYFNKIACFCFTEQRLEPGQSVDMPVTFFVDPAMADDAFAAQATTITLSYTFFRQAPS